MHCYQTATFSDSFILKKTFIVFFRTPLPFKKKSQINLSISQLNKVDLLHNKNFG